MSTNDVAAFARALPKVELHVHLVGSASVPTVLALAARHGAATVPSDPAELAEYYRFRDFAHFVDIYQTVNALVTGPADVTDLVVGLARDAAAGGVRYAEVTVTPMSHVHVGMDPAAVADALLEGRERAAAEFGIELGWIFDTAGELGVENAWDTLDWVLKHRPEGTVGYGLAGPEIGIGRALFTRPFTVAREAGLHSLPHAGETTGPATVWSALTDLGAERIGHGIHSVTDPRLLDHLAEHRIPLEVCPTSNVRTGAVPSMAAHPLPRLLQWGVPVTLNTDDPGMFDCDIAGEYLVAHEAFGLTPAELAQIARTGVDAAFCSAELKRTLHAEIDALALPEI
ncbi:adenosine deaminase [Pseudonocardia sp. TRM90224]|uniref:adenosine deaminase n=1 Tax=Pseudonocardia sp. TRM90224 TaxID=2812678 RepID=UPI001E5BED95|nr:adenosine deaminase [Pseudonocardia sp. TRM90224]